MIPQLSHSDLTQAAADAVLYRAGIRQFHSPGMHPAAAQLVESGVSPLKLVAQACGRAAPRGRQMELNDAQAFTAGMGTADFTKFLINSGKQVVARVLSAATDHRQLCRPLTARDFKDVAYPSFNADIALALATNESADEAGISNVADEDGLTSGVKTYRAILQLTRKLLINDDGSLLAGLFNQTGGALARLEAQLIAQLVEANITLGDGMPMFDAAFENIEANAFSKAALGTAIGRLRTMTALTGGKANLTAAALYVAADLEMAARETVHQANLPIVVVASAWLSAGRWYLFADPVVAPVVGLVRLDANPAGWLLLPMRRKPAFDGTCLGVVADLDVVALGRVGVVRGGA